MDPYLSLRSISFILLCRVPKDEKMIAEIDKADPSNGAAVHMQIVESLAQKNDTTEVGVQCSVANELLHLKPLTQEPLEQKQRNSASKTENYFRPKPIFPKPKNLTKTKQIPRRKDLPFNLQAI